VAMRINPFPVLTTTFHRVEGEWVVVDHTAQGGPEVLPGWALPDDRWPEDWVRVGAVRPFLRPVKVQAMPRPDRFSLVGVTPIWWVGAGGDFSLHDGWAAPAEPEEPIKLAGARVKGGKKGRVREARSFLRDLELAGSTVFARLDGDRVWIELLERGPLDQLLIERGLAVPVQSHAATPVAR
jgi:hypothetical protein